METSKDRRALARDAGMGQLSLTSILAGTLTAYGAVAVLLAIAGGVAAAINNGTDFSNVAWTQLKAGVGITVAVALFVSFLYGGYVAGRLARRSGARNAFGVFVLGVVMAVAIGVLVKQAGGGSTLTNALRDSGAPTTWHEWRDVGTIAGIASLVAMLLGSLVGGSLGDRWHSKLVARALDPTIGPEAELSRQAATKAAQADDAHLAAEERVASSGGVHFATPAAASGAAVAERQAQREDRLADGRGGVDDQASTVPVTADPTARLAPAERTAAASGTPDGHPPVERADASDTASTRGGTFTPSQTAAADADDYRPDTLAPTRHSPVSEGDGLDDRATAIDRVTVPDDSSDRMASSGGPARQRNFLDRLLHR